MRKFPKEAHSCGRFNDAVEVEVLAIPTHQTFWLDTRKSNESPRDGLESQTRFV